MKGPIVVGGIGGSGTRAVASILQSFNIYIGDDLNVSLDNLSYTFLFRRPGWYIKNHDRNGLIDTGLGILEKRLGMGGRLSGKEKLFMANAACWHATHRQANRHRNKAKWIVQRLKHLSGGDRRDVSTCKAWGWKEPNSHILLEHLVRYYPGIKYIHTIRHGLDMAYSSNQSQLYNWGGYMGVKIPVSKEDEPAASFRYWVEVNKSMLEKRRSLGEGKVLLLNFDRMCQHPAGEIQKMLDFLEMEVTEDELHQAVKIPVAPASSGRFRREDSFDLKDFLKEDVEFLEALGFFSV